MTETAAATIRGPLSGLVVLVIINSEAVGTRKNEKSVRYRSSIRECAMIERVVNMLLRVSSQTMEEGRGG